jgi:hypothetical protein
MTGFGCDYCRDEQNRLFGHVSQIASDEARRMILLRCPRCSALYENTPDGPDQTRRLNQVEARSLFPEFVQFRRIERAAEIGEAVRRFIETQNDPALEKRTKALSDIGLLLEEVVGEDGLVDDKSLAASLDGLAARRVVITDDSTLLEIIGAFYALVTRDGRTGELMLPMHARLSIEPGAISTMRVSGRASMLETPKSERQFQRA